MRISEVDSQSSYMMLGGLRTDSGRVQESAFAFKIMSDTLYRDKKLAVVREVLCNANDANIARGVVTPVRVTLDESKLEIEDDGDGIPDEDIADIYLTLFGSTKRSDDSLTGGFGLGSKAPFAYTDHFTITNCHNGVRYVYALHRGDETTSGKPGITLMGKGPTERSGLTVTIPIAEHGDIAEFGAKIRQAVLEGALCATLNGDLLPVEDYDELAKRGWHLQGAHCEDIRLFYAGVVYPVERHDSISKLHGIVSRHLQSGNMSIILYAEPGSVQPTPSRESLSMEPKTIATIKNRLHAFLSTYQRDFRPAVIDLFRRGISRQGSVDLINLIPSRNHILTETDPNEGPMHLLARRTVGRGRSVTDFGAEFVQAAQSCLPMYRRLLRRSRAAAGPRQHSRTKYRQAFGPNRPLFWKESHPHFVVQKAMFKRLTRLFDHDPSLIRVLRVQRCGSQRLEPLRKVPINKLPALSDTHPSTRVVVAHRIWQAMESNAEIAVIAEPGRVIDHAKLIERGKKLGFRVEFLPMVEPRKRPKTERKPKEESVEAYYGFSNDPIVTATGGELRFRHAGITDPKYYLDIDTQRSGAGGYVPKSGSLHTRETPALGLFANTAISPSKSASKGLEARNLPCLAETIFSEVERRLGRANPVERVFIGLLMSAAATQSLRRIPPRYSSVMTFVSNGLDHLEFACALTGRSFAILRKHQALWDYWKQHLLAIGILAKLGARFNDGSNFSARFNKLLDDIDAHLQQWGTARFMEDDAPDTVTWLKANFIFDTYSTFHSNDASSHKKLIIDTLIFLRKRHYNLNK